MSIIHNIIPQIPLHVSALNERILQVENAWCEDRGEVFYYWNQGKSTRGMDITISDDNIEIRNTILSNEADYVLTNSIIEEIVLLTDGQVFSEEGNIINSKVFSKEKMLDLEVRDCENILRFCKGHEDVAIYGPVRQVHFGMKMYKELKLFKGRQLVDEVFKIILNIQYHIPDFSYGDILEVGKGDDKKIVKVLTNKTDCIIDKYDYIILHEDSADSIMITNSILNGILPDAWKLVDEFTIVAGILSDSDWQKLKEKARPFNQEMSSL